MFHLLDQLGPEGRVGEKLLSISPFFFSKFLKTDINLLFLIKHHLEEIREGIIKLNGVGPLMTDPPPISSTTLSGKKKKKKKK